MGDTSADQNTKSDAQAVRGGFVATEREVTNKLSSETHDTHKQQVTIADSSHVVDVQTETGFIQTIDNSDNPNNLNIEFFQLTQEYIVVSALVDAELVFHNDDPRAARSVPIREMDSLLEECIIEEAARARIAATVIDVLSNVVDRTGQTRSLLVPVAAGGERFRVDPGLRSAFPVEDSQGNPFRTIAVPGIVVNVDRLVVLTPNTEMALIDGP